MKRDTQMSYCLDSPLGEIEVALNDAYLVGLRFADGQLRSTLPQAPGAVRSLLANWFAGRSSGLEMVSPQLPGTEFQREVWRALRSIPRGESISYRALAAQLGRPRSVRAVAAAVAANPVLLLLPCHRVIGADGQLRGYAGGVERKRALLELERAPMGEGA